MTGTRPERTSVASGHGRYHPNRRSRFDHHDRSRRVGRRHRPGRIDLHAHRPRRCRGPREPDPCQGAHQGRRGRAPGERCHRGGGLPDPGPARRAARGHRILAVPRGRVGHVRRRGVLEGVPSDHRFPRGRVRERQARRAAGGVRGRAPGRFPAPGPESEQRPAVRGHVLHHAGGRSREHPVLARGDRRGEHAAAAPTAAVRGRWRRNDAQSRHRRGGRRRSAGQVPAAGRPGTRRRAGAQRPPPGRGGRGRRVPPGSARAPRPPASAR